MGGDTVESRNGLVYVNGERIEEPYLVEGTPTERLPLTAVPDGEVFVMGDNRTNSEDSRDFGPIDEDTIVGAPWSRCCRCRTSAGCDGRATPCRSAVSRVGVGGVDGRDHAVDVVAVDAVDAEVDQLVEDPRRLGVPPEGQHAEPVEQGGQAAGPVEVVHVDRVDAPGRQGRGPPLGAPP